MDPLLSGKRVNAGKLCPSPAPPVPEPFLVEGLTFAMWPKDGRPFDVAPEIKHRRQVGNEGAAVQLSK